ncbi:MAG: hypothetical protein E7177_06735 [Erysipelotrichaceae bacterium]|nr:hypothetical protein [Erysipelotrichaceae bacterium]
MKMKKAILSVLSAAAIATTCTSCDDLFLFISVGSSSSEVNSSEIISGDSSQEIIPSYIPFENTKNSIFFALYNYYGQDGQHFTNRWLGMKDALANHGITVTGDSYEKDAKKFKIKREDNCDLPADAKIYMVNNQTWDTGLQFTKPLTNYKPMAVISTCNGVEFASAQIKANSPGTQNATMGGFSVNYRNAFADNSLAYLTGKYSCNIAPIVAAGANAVRGNPLRVNDGGADGDALRLSVTQWSMKSLEEYDYYKSIDVVGNEEGVNPTIMKADIDKFFTKGSEFNTAQALTEWCANSTFENIKSIYDANRNAQDTPFTGEKIKVGLLVPGSVNDTVQANIDYISGYLSKVYNFEMLTKEEITSSNDQKKACIAMCNKGAQLIISLQDDTNRNSAIAEANSRGVYFANAGTCQNDMDYAATKDYKYFVGSIGSSIEEERRATREMTEYYLQKMIDRANGIDITKGTVFEGQ